MHQKYHELPDERSTRDHNPAMGSAEGEGEGTSLICAKQKFNLRCYEVMAWDLTNDASGCR